MALRNRLELRSDVAMSCRETQIDTNIEDWINVTLQEINDPAWAYEQTGMKGFSHLWTFNRRKHSLTTVTDQEDYTLPRDVDKLGIVRQTTSPTKLLYIPDEIAYEFIPNPTATGNPRYYRLWEEEGLSTSLSTDDTIDVVSSSASDGSSFTVTVVGYDNNGIRVSEEYTLNGTTAVSGSTTFDARKPIRVSKSGETTGSITVTENSGSTTLVVLGPEERSPRFKVISFYPIPSSAISIYIEYFTRIRMLANDADVPDIDEKWAWVVRLGTMAKVYQYQNKESMYNSSQALYAAGVRSMIKADIQNPDFIPTLRPQHMHKTGRVTYSDLGYGSYGLTY